MLPQPGQPIFVLVSANAGGTEGGLGRDSAGGLRPITHPCP